MRSEEWRCAAQFIKRREFQNGKVFPLMPSSLKGVLEGRVIAYKMAKPTDLTSFLRKGEGPKGGG